MHVLVVWKHGQKSLFTCYAVSLSSLTRLQNETFNCSKHGFLNSWYSNISIKFFSYLWNGKWYQNVFCVKMILEFCRIHWQQNYNLALWRHQPHLPVLGHKLVSSGFDQRKSKPAQPHENYWQKGQREDLIIRINLNKLSAYRWKFKLVLNFVMWHMSSSGKSCDVVRICYLLWPSWHQSEESFIWGQ